LEFISFSDLLLYNCEKIDAIFETYFSTSVLEHNTIYTLSSSEQNEMSFCEIILIVNHVRKENASRKLRRNDSMPRFVLMIH